MSRRTLCRATLPKHTCTANRTGPSILPRQDRNSVLHTDLICFRSSMAWRSRSNCDHSSFVPTGTFPPQFPPSPLLNWLAKRHRFTAFVSLSLYRNIFGEAMEGRNERNEEHMITSSVPSPPSPRPPAPLTLLFHSDLLPFLRFARNYFRVFLSLLGAGFSVRALSICRSRFSRWRSLTHGQADRACNMLCGPFLRSPLTPNPHSPSPKRI